MITPEDHLAYLRGEKPITEDLLLPAQYDNVAVWEKYITEDPKAIYGGGSHDPRMIYYANRLLALGAGVQMYLPPVGMVLDIGAGYNPIGGIVSEYCQYYPVDILRHTPLTIVIEPGNIGFSDETFDCVTCCNVFQHLRPEERMQYVAEAFRLLKPHGFLFIACTIENPDIKNPDHIAGSYAVTGDYLVPAVTAEEADTWSLHLGTARFQAMFKGSRSDGFATRWFKKIPVEQTDDSE